MLLRLVSHILPYLNSPFYFTIIFMVKRLKKYTAVKNIFMIAFLLSINSDDFYERLYSNNFTRIDKGK